MARTSTRLLTATGLLIGTLAAAPDANAQSRDADKIEPYTGPPILLPEPEAPPQPRPVETKPNKSTYEDGTTKTEHTITRYSDDSLVSNGPYREYYPSGQLFVDGSFSAGAPNGEWTYYHPKGEVAKKVTYKKGQPDGAVEALREDGTLESKRTYANGKRTGVWENYAEDGKQLRRQQSYANGKLDGPIKIWFPDGTLFRELNYKNGLLDGVSTQWDQEGKKRSEVRFTAGKRNGASIRWSAVGDKTVLNYKDGKLVP